MIYFLIPYFMLSSFLTGSFWEYNDRDAKLEDVLSYLFALVFSPLIAALAIFRRIYKHLTSK
jgi:hypothetical protein